MLLLFSSYVFPAAAAAVDLVDRSSLTLLSFVGFGVLIGGFLSAMRTRQQRSL